MNYQVTGNIETKTSNKTGKPYECLVIKLTPTYEKLIFFTSAELELIKARTVNK